GTRGDDEARSSRAARRGDPVRARRRARGVGARRSADRARRRLPRAAAGRGACAARTRRRRHARRAPAGGLAAEGVGRRGPRRPDLRADRGAGHARDHRADELNVMAMRLKVSPLEDVLVSELLALHEQEPDLGQVIELARSLREQIDWDEVRRRTESSPLAKAFFTYVEELGVVPKAA